MATAMAPAGTNPFAPAPGSARGVHSAQAKQSARGNDRQRGGAAAVLAGVLLQGAEKAWLKQMADTSLEDIEKIREESREKVRNVARTPNTPSVPH